MEKVNAIYDILCYKSFFCCKFVSIEYQKMEIMYKRINKENAIEILSNPEAILFDIRDKESYEERHVNDAIHLTMNNLPKLILEIEKSRPVLIMCYHGNSSQSMADYFVKNGFIDVYSIDGGYEGWMDELV